MARSRQGKPTNHEMPRKGHHPGTQEEPCFFEVNGILGWTNSGTSGQFQPGPPATTAYFNYVPDGITVAYSNDTGAVISQTVGETAVAGVTYTLSVEIGQRNDLPATGIASLDVGGFAVPLTQFGPSSLGGWTLFTASHTATDAEAGGAITIKLANLGGAQADFDNVVLSNDLPEPAGMALLTLGMIGLGWARRRKA